MKGSTDRPGIGVRIRRPGLLRGNALVAELSTQLILTGM